MERKGRNVEREVIFKEKKSDLDSAVWNFWDSQNLKKHSRPQIKCHVINPIRLGVKVRNLRWILKFKCSKKATQKG